MEAMDVVKVQEALKAEGLEGWLLFSFGRSNPLALEVLGHPLRPTAETLADTARWLCAEGHLPAKYVPALAP